MRSVKGTRRRSVGQAAGRTAVAAAVILAAACTRAPPPPAASAELDCRDVVRRPVGPRVMAVADDGRVEPGPACGSATCLAGARDAWLWGDGAALHATVGAHAYDLPARPASPLRATRSLAGAVLGRGTVVVDEGGGNAGILTADGAHRTVPLPDLGARTMARAAVAAGGVLLTAFAPEDRAPPVELVARTTKAPPGATRAVIDEASDSVVGWLVPGADAALVSLDGTRRSLGLALTPAADVLLAGGTYVAVDRTQRAVVGFARPPLPFDRHIGLFDDVGGALVAFDARGAGAVVGFSDGAFHTLLALPLPDGTRALRAEAAEHRGRFLVLQRVQDAGCSVRDRLILVDVRTRPPTFTVVADDGDMRMHPQWAGDRFRFVQGAAELASP